MKRLIWTAGAVLLWTVACTGSQAAGPTASSSPSTTLRVGMVADGAQNFDPAKEYPPSVTPSWELFRCCLLRTLLSYNGRPTDRGGSVLRPDLAADLPDVSGDGLTWTFHIRPGIRYAPPFDDTEIVAGDFIRALRRSADPIASSGGTYSFYYGVIAGFDDYAADAAVDISGLDAPDDHTLVVELDQPAGDLGYRLSLPAAAPIPPDPTDPSAPMGVAQAHQADYGRYLVASGPYMLEGSEDLDFTGSPLLQPAVAGYRPGESLTLVRNPSWSAEQDPLRGAYVDRIEITLGRWNGIEYDPGEVAARMSDRVVAGDLDLVLDGNPTPEQIARYRSDAELRDHVHSDASNGLRYLSMNLAMPPFDDVHVRRAVSYAIDREAVAGAMTGLGLSVEPATHLAVDSLEGGLLSAFAPYRTDLAKAKAEMALSKYDHDGDGICDASACVGVRYEELLYETNVSVWPPAFKESLHAIGLELARMSMPYSLGSPVDKIPIEFGQDLVWQSDFTNGSSFFVPLFSGRAIVTNPSFRTLNYNVSLLGATRGELKEWGYAVRSVPSVDQRIDRCLAQIGRAQAECWAEIDQFLMQNIVPAVPLLNDQVVRVVSARVSGYSLDQFTALPALDRIALAPGSS